LESIKQLGDEWRLLEGKEIQISEDMEIDGITTYRYITNYFFFMVSYQNNQAVKIAVDYELRNHGIITIFEKDIFKTTAEDMISFLQQYSSCVYTSEDILLDTDYEFPEMGVRLWREDVFHKNILLDGEYMSEMQYVIEEMYQYLYFQMIEVY